MGNQKFWIFLVLVFTLLCNTTQALYEHEVGRNDWAIQTLGGDIYDAQISDQHPNLIFTISHKILTAVSKTRGDIRWRKELPVEGQCFHMDVEGHYILAHSSADILVFKAETGELVSSLNAEHAITSAMMVVPRDNSAPTIVYSEKDGATYSYKNAKKQATDEQRYVAFGKTKIGKVIGLSQTSSSYSVYEVDPTDLKASKIKSSISINTKGSEEPLIWSNMKYFAIIGHKDKVVRSITKVFLDGKSEDLSNVNKLTIDDLYMTSTELVAAHASSTNLGSKVTLQLGSKGLTVTTDKNSEAINDIDFATNGNIKRSFVLDNKHYLVQMSDLSIHLLENDPLKVQWTRHEAVAVVNNFKFLDITEPAEAKSEIIHFMKHLESMDDNVAKIPVKILTRYTHHIQKLINFLSNLPEIIQENFKPKESTFERDSFGFKKILVGLTSDHQTLVGLQSNNGQRLWTLHFSKLIKDFKLLSGSDDKVVFSDFHLIEKEEEDNEAVIILASKNRNSLVITVDPYNGEVKNTKLISGRQIKNTFKIHLASLHEIVLLVDSEKRTSFYPFQLTDEMRQELLHVSYYEFEETEKGLDIVGHSFDIDS